MAARVACYRCGRQISPLEPEFERWVVVHAWLDREILACPECQMASERRIAESVKRDLENG